LKDNRLTLKAFFDTHKGIGSKFAKVLNIDLPTISHMVNGNRPISQEFKDLFIETLDYIKFDQSRIVYPDDAEYASVLDQETGPETPAQFINRHGWSLRKLADAIPVASIGRLDRVLKGRSHLAKEYQDIHIMGQIVKVMKLPRFTDFPWQHKTQQDFAYRTDLLTASGVDVNNPDEMFLLIKDSLTEADTAKTESGQ
jgi:hypothetical protein